MSKLDSYKKEHAKIKELLDIVFNWGAKFQLENKLSFITSEELLGIYNEIDNLEDVFLYDKSLGNEAMLSNQAKIWMWEIMELRKKQIEDTN